MSRTSSTNTIQHVQRSPPVLNQNSDVDSGSAQKPRNTSREPQRKAADPPQRLRQYSFDRPRTPPAKAIDSSASSSSESESEAEAPMSRSRAYTRRPRYSSSKAPLRALSDADEDSEESPPFLPFSEAKGSSKAAPQAPDPSATLRLSPHEQAFQQLGSKAETKPRQTLKPAQTVNSSSSSAQSQPTRPPQAPLSSLSPRQRRLAKEGSEGTPSMGSSFSDLDDASVTQSALEEALANEMTHGGVASRMSSISQALRSRYL